MSVLITNGRIITVTDDFIGDIYIEGEKIVSIGKHLDITADHTIDATGQLVMPGGIDPHVHLDMPFMGTFSSDSYETGTRAALFGGTTTVIDFILQKQGHSLRGVYSYTGGFHRRAIVSLLLGIIPNIPGFLATIGLIGRDALPAWIISLYSYAWFVGFFVSGACYLLSFNFKKQVNYVSIDY